MRREAETAQREVDSIPGQHEGQLLFQAEQVRGAVAAAVADNLLYWAERIQRAARKS